MACCLTQAALAARREFATHSPPKISNGGANITGGLLERLFNVNVYFKAYSKMMLDQYAELERWRAIGVPTVGAPPQGIKAK